MISNTAYSQWPSNALFFGRITITLSQSASQQVSQADEVGTTCPSVRHLYTRERGTVDWPLRNTPYTPCPVIHHVTLKIGYVTLSGQCVTVTTTHAKLTHDTGEVVPYITPFI